MSDKGSKRPGSLVSNPSIPWSTRNKSESAVTKSGKLPASPSPSASIILISPTSRILLLHRVQTSSSFPSAHVFPGGNLEPSDGDLASGDTNIHRHQDNLAYRTGAIRELFEETGILLARESSDTSSRLLSLPLQRRLEGRKQIHGHQVDISTWLTRQAAGSVLDTDALVPFTRWITPTNVPKRFTTQMYLYFVPLTDPEEVEGGRVRDQSSSYSSLIATSDEVETMEPEWMYAYEWLDRARSGEIILFPPQFLLLSLVSRFLDGWSPSPSSSFSPPPPPPSSSSSSSSTPTCTSTITVTRNKDEIARRRNDLVQFVMGHIDNNKNSKTIPWRDKVISPSALSFTREDGRAVLGLDKPGPELRDAFKDGVVKGDDSLVVLVRGSKEGPRDVEVRDRAETLREEREGKQKSRL